MFTGRKKELAALQKLYDRNAFQLFILYGRRRVGKTALLTEFCRDKEAIFFSAEETNERLNLEKLSELIFDYYGEDKLAPFTSFANAITYINDKQNDSPLVLVIDEFPYLAAINPGLLSILQHLIDHTLQYGHLFLVLCGSYLGFMEKSVLGAKSPLFGRRTAQLKLLPFTYQECLPFFAGLSAEEKVMLYGAVGGTPLYLQKINPALSFQENITELFLEPTGYLYNEPKMLLQQEVNEPGIYNAVIGAIAGGATKAGEIAGKTGEENAKCLKYINVLRELGLIQRETPFGERETSRKNIYELSDFMFRFWYRYVGKNLTLLETGAKEIVWQRRILPDYNTYLGLTFERICREWLLVQNASGALPILATGVGRWWGANPYSAEHEQLEIDLIANDGEEYLFAECKWRNELTDLSILEQLRKKADCFRKHRGRSFYLLFSKSGFTEGLKAAAAADSSVRLIGLTELGLNSDK